RKVSTPKRASRTVFQMLYTLMHQSFMARRNVGQLTTGKIIQRKAIAKMVKVVAQSMFTKANCHSSRREYTTTRAHSLVDKLGSIDERCCINFQDLSVFKFQIAFSC